MVIAEPEPRVKAHVRALRVAHRLPHCHLPPRLSPAHAPHLRRRLHASNLPQLAVTMLAPPRHREAETVRQARGAIALLHAFLLRACRSLLAFILRAARLHRRLGGGCIGGAVSARRHADGGQMDEAEVR
eukprot:scaffold108235_cov33-Phaeocystis_antarctica.AAC.1